MSSGNGEYKVPTPASRPSDNAGPARVQPAVCDSHKSGTAQAVRFVCDLPKYAITAGLAPCRYLAVAQTTGCTWPAVLAIGDGSHPELATVQPSLEGCCCWTHVRDLEQAIAALAAAEAIPDLILFCQSRPGEFPQPLVSQLRRAAPLTGLCAVLGSQCEGETRTGQPLMGMPRVFWYHWPAFWQEQQARLRQGLPPAWSLPATASEEERLLQGCQHAPCTDVSGTATQLKAAHIAVLAESAESARALADAVRSAGHWVEIWSPSAERIPAAADIVLWDAAIATLTDRRRVQSLQRRFPTAAILGVATFPRLQDQSAARAAGLQAILAKPFRLEHLFAQLERE